MLYLRLRQCQVLSSAVILLCPGIHACLGSLSTKGWYSLPVSIQMVIWYFDKMLFCLLSFFFLNIIKMFCLSIVLYQILTWQLPTWAEQKIQGFSEGAVIDVRAAEWNLRVWKDIERSSLEQPGPLEQAVWTALWAAVKILKSTHMLTFFCNQMLLLKPHFILIDSSPSVATSFTCSSQRFSPLW